MRSRLAICEYRLCESQPVRFLTDTIDGDSPHSMLLIDATHTDTAVAAAGLRAAWDRTHLVVGAGIARFVFQRATHDASVAYPSLVSSALAFDDRELHIAGPLAPCAARAVVAEVTLALETLAGPRVAAVVRADADAVERVHRVLALRTRSAATG
jgi:hypothetical protein